MILHMAQKWPIFDVLMVRYNAAHRGAEHEIFSHLDEKDRQGIVAFNALKHGAMLKRPRGWPILAWISAFLDRANSTM